jgi:hypothetical protein
MTVPGIGPIIASAMVAAIGNGIAFARGRDFAACRGQRMIVPSSAASPSVAIAIYARSSCKAPALFCSDQQTGRNIVLGCGSRLRRNAYITTSWQPHSPISWRGSPGLCWHKVAATKRGSSRKSHKIDVFGPPRGCSRLIPEALEECNTTYRGLRVGFEEMEKRSRRRTRDLVVLVASQGISKMVARISIMARITNAPCKGRIQKRKTTLHLLKSGLQRTAGKCQDRTSL